jgi:HPt (histidine-containing phosphotransfer) domain-containing protein
LLDFSAGSMKKVAAPPLVPGDQLLDLPHLFRMTLGDHDLEREVLQVFEQQAAMLTGRMRGAAPACVAAMAHTLRGSALGIGAWRVARAADQVERTAGQERAEQDLKTSIDALTVAAEEVRVLIADLLAAH